MPAGRSSAKKTALPALRHLQESCRLIELIGGVLSRAAFWKPPAPVFPISIGTASPSFRSLSAVPTQQIALVCIMLMLVDNYSCAWATLLNGSEESAVILLICPRWDELGEPVASHLHSIGGIESATTL
jgi:hypothetical protein